MLVSSGATNFPEMEIIKGKHCWNLWIDITVFDTGGSLLDTMMVATYAALHNLQLPALKVTHAAADKSGTVGEEDPDASEAVFELDSEASLGVSLTLDGFPLGVTFHSIGGQLVVDCTVEEEQCAEAAATVAVTRAGKVVCIETSGSNGLSPSMLSHSLAAVPGTGRVLFQRMDAQLAAADDTSSAAVVRGQYGVSTDMHAAFVPLGLSAGDGSAAEVGMGGGEGADVTDAELNDLIAASGLAEGLTDLEQRAMGLGASKQGGNS